MKDQLLEVKSIELKNTVFDEVKLKGDTISCCDDYINNFQVQMTRMRK